MNESNKSLKSKWKDFEKKHKGLSEFILFTVVSQGVTILQWILLMFFGAIFAAMALNASDIQLLKFTENQYLFNYVSQNTYDSLSATNNLGNAISGGVGFFLANLLTLAIAQVINFFGQRKITFKSDGNPWIAAMWYFIAWVVIFILSSYALALYNTPVKNALGDALGTVVVTLVNATISYWVFFPIFKIIFKQKQNKEV